MIRCRLIQDLVESASRRQNFALIPFTFACMEAWAAQLRRLWTFEKFTRKSFAYQSRCWPSTVSHSS